MVRPYYKVWLVPKTSQRPKLVLTSEQLEKLTPLAHSRTIQRAVRGHDASAETLTHLSDNFRHRQDLVADQRIGIKPAESRSLQEPSDRGFSASDPG